MSKINILGSTSLIGSYFVDSNLDNELICFSRKRRICTFLDLQNENTFSNFECENSFLVSFAPIWLVQNLIIKLEQSNKSKLKTLKGAIFYSSSSALTKKFASNEFDKNLSKKLISAENKILSIFKKYSINCLIIRPTIVYGIYKELDDRNYTKIVKILKKFPFCIIPSRTGLRQPIHFSQLSELTYIFLDQFKNSKLNEKVCKIVEVGGDEELSYSDLLLRLSMFSTNTFFKKCRVIPVPNKIFYLIIFPLLIFKPKIFERLYRMQSDLSGFPKYSYYTGKSSKKFPLENFK